MMERSTKPKASKKGLLYKIVNQHPFRTYLYMAILGIAFLFFVLIVAFQATKNPLLTLQLPKSFIVSTFLLTVSSLCLKNVLYLYDHDKAISLRNQLLTVSLLGLAFGVSQGVAWKELAAKGIVLNGQVSGSYLYVISGLHLIHLIGGLAFVYVETLRVWFKSKDVVKSLIYFTDPYQRLKLELICIYWHFMDLLWIILFFYFLFSL